MISRTTAEATRIAAGDDRVRYDPLEITLHWATALLVVTMWTLAQTWDYAARGSALREGMQSLHVSFGLLLILVLVARISWRLGPGRRVPPAGTGLLERVAQGLHYLLYALLLAVVCLGVSYRWASHDPLSFFGLFTIPSPFEFSKQDQMTVGGLHANVANIIIILAGLHAAAALFHHYVLRDDVLWRMLPGVRARRAERTAPDPRTQVR
jgi:cytochrome b561